MWTIKPSFEILSHISEGGIEELKMMELIGRVSHKSEDKITPDGESAKKFVKRYAIDMGHEAILEHIYVTVRFICDRGVSHEIVRHRMASYIQESTRYVNYGGKMEFIEPCFFESFEQMEMWFNACKKAEIAYKQLLDAGSKPQEARTVLPNSLKTELIMTANLREWRHFFKLRCDHAAHPQMRELAIPLLQEMHRRIPIVFDDILNDVAEFYSGNAVYWKEEETK